MADVKNEMNGREIFSRRDLRGGVQKFIKPDPAALGLPAQHALVEKRRIAQCAGDSFSSNTARRTKSTRNGKRSGSLRSCWAAWLVIAEA